MELKAIPTLNEHFNEIKKGLAEQEVNNIKHFGKVASVVGTIIECSGLQGSVGELFGIHSTTGEMIPAEVVGLKDGKTLLMPFDRVTGMKAGCLVENIGQSMNISVGSKLLGRVVDTNGKPIDGKGHLQTTHQQPVHNSPPSPLDRAPINEIMHTGIRSLDALNTIGIGQRVGLFAGSGVGKSVLLGMIAKHSSADVNVIGLIGERGREVQEFVHDTLGEEGLAKSVVVTATSDTAAMSRVKGAFTATAIAEYFRDKGKNVLLMMDSVTRVAMAQREIGLASGEPPTTKGYTPSVFTILPKLLERPGKTERGSITGLYTVLVDNDDMNEPIADAVRSILDGHIVLSRRLAHKNHYPAIDVLESISRVMPKIVNDEQRNIAMKAREILATYREAEDLINIGAYVKGSNPKIDDAIKKYPSLESFLIQDLNESDFDQNLWETLKKIIN
ncbi:MAG: flagellar protein export ATPase FliI [Balneola sp.]|nr:flagellar protein export ATPase FliI [Balneola sp.]|tara:strand:+ start:55495 stop:56832 length:1338 start_codon:yes stop_codon:yes gene_type:complete